MWNSTCANIFSDCVEKLNEKNIRYFILRNYEGLPEQNSSKDVDIIVEPKKIKEAKEILLDVYKKNGIERVYKVRFGNVHCIHGMSFKNKIGIHIDLIAGYFAKGYEVYKFDALYRHTEDYKNFRVLNEFYNGIMIYIYKQFGYKKPVLKDEYREEIVKTYEKYPDEFERELSRLTDDQFAKEAVDKIKANDFDGVLEDSKKLTKKLRKFVRRKRPIRTLRFSLSFFFQKVWRIFFAYRYHARVCAVIAPDGAGKTTFIDEIVKQLDYYYVNSPDAPRMHVYHFRPTMLPNLGEVGEKAHVMKQDKNFTDPHRLKPANPVSSFFRIAYYTIDYIFGYMKCIRQDVHYDRHVLFDRYSYDFIVDPRRSRLNLPKWMRIFFVFLTPSPKIVYLLDASEDVIYQRKQELPKEMIKELLDGYRELAKNKKRFKTLDAEQEPEKIAEDAVKIFLERFTSEV